MSRYEEISLSTYTDFENYKSDKLSLLMISASK